MKITTKELKQLIQEQVKKLVENDLNEYMFLPHVTEAQQDLEQAIITAIHVGIKPEQINETVKTSIAKAINNPSKLDKEEPGRGHYDSGTNI